MDSHVTNTNPVPRLLLTPEQAADALGLGRSSVYELMRARRLRSVKVGRSRRVPYESLLDFVSHLEQLAGAETVMPTSPLDQPARPGDNATFP